MSTSPVSWLAADGGGSVALVEAGTGLGVTYSQLEERVQVAVAHRPALRGAVVLLGVSNTIDSVVDYLAAVEAGATVLLANPSTPGEVLDGWCRAYRPDVLTGFSNRPPVFGDGDGSARNDAVLLATSGSTGSPKFVRLSRGNLAHNAGQIVDALRIGPEDRVFAHLPLFYSYGLSVLNSHLHAGATVVLTTDSTTSAAFWDELAHCQVTSLPGVPYSYEMFHRMGLAERAFPHLRDLTQAGGRLETSKVLEFHQMMASRGGRMWVMYGQTEASARISVLPPEDLPDRLGSVGRAVRGSELWVDAPDESGAGELKVRGPQVMLGYASSRNDLDGPDDCGGVLATGDIGRVDPDGFVYITGRLKRIAKVFGTRVNLDDIEHQLSGFGHLAAVADGNCIAVFIEMDDPPSGLARAMERHIGLPVRGLRVYGLADLPTTAAGKIDYTELHDACRI